MRVQSHNPEADAHRKLPASSMRSASKQLPPLPEQPGVSYVMPVLNERDYLESAVATVLAQNYAGEKELILALGPSSDGTTELAQRLASTDPRVRLVDNPARDIAAGLNLAVRASRHPVIIRVDAHSELPADYTAGAVQSLRETGAANVGGVMRASASPSSPTQRAIAACYNSPFGLGGGAYHGDGEPAEAESAYLGCFRREAYEAVGGFDESVLRGEDWEFNLRLRRQGFKVWFCPSLNVVYRPRASFSALARQFFATGAWRAELVRRYGRANPWRFFLPGLLVLLLGISLCTLLACAAGLLAPLHPLMVLTLPLPAYLLGSLAAALLINRQAKVGSPLRVLVALWIMHCLWGSGFVKGITLGPGRTVDRSRITA